MSAHAQEPARDPSIRRRRATLYVAAAVALIVVAAVAARSLLSRGDDSAKKPVKLSAPLIVSRIQMKPVDGSSARGLAEVLRRSSGDALRILAARLEPSKNDQVYRLVLTGGAEDEKLLGNEVVGAQGIFVGESKLPIDTLRKYRRVELRLVTNGNPPTDKTVLRGKIPQ